MLCRDGCTKVFQKPLDFKKVEKNRSKGIEITSALKTSRKNEVSLEATPCGTLSGFCEHIVCCAVLLTQCMCKG